MDKLYSVRDASKILGISYPTLKQWIYKGKIGSVRTAGGHHRISQQEVDRFLSIRPLPTRTRRRDSFRSISGRNQLAGRIVEIKIHGLMAQVTLSIGSQHITSIITADAVREMGLKKGQIAAALIKATEVMIIVPR